MARSALGAEQTGVTHFRLRAGKRSPFSHRHARAEEIFRGTRPSIKFEFRCVRPIVADATRLKLFVQQPPRIGAGTAPLLLFDEAVA